MKRYTFNALMMGMVSQPGGDYILFTDHEAAISELVEALEPFAFFDCDPPCGCHNCRAKELVSRIKEKQ